MYPVLDLGPFIIPTAGLVYILGAWLALSLVEQAALRLGLNVPDTYGTAVVALAVGVVGARLVFVALNWPAYADDPLAIIWPITSGYTPWAGVLLGAAAAIYYGRWKGLHSAATLDALAPGLLTGLMLLSLADFLAGPGYGKPVDLPWSINFFGILRHPVQIYEIIVGLLALGVWRYAARPGTIIVAGRSFLAAAATYSAGRLLVDAFRANTPLMAGGYHLVQIASLVVLLLCLFLLLRTSETVPEVATPADAGHSD